MSNRLKTAVSVAAILVVAVLVSLVIRIVAAEEEPVRRHLEVASSVDLGEGLYLVRPVERPAPGERMAIEAITHYPLGFAVVRAGGDGQARQAEVQPVAVRTVRLEPGPLARTVVAFGTVTAWRDARPAAELPGTVRAADLALGRPVAEGEPLVELDARDRAIALRRAEAEVAQAAARLEQATRNVASLEEQLAIAETTLESRTREKDRWAELAQRSIASHDRAEDADRQWRAAQAQRQRLDGELSVARASLNGAEAALALARAVRDGAALDLERCTVRAPFAGVVAERLIEVGDHVSPGTPVARLVAHDRVRIRAHVREEDALALVPGAGATVTLPGVPHLEVPATDASGAGTPTGTAAATFPARVEGVAGAADAGTRKFAVDVVADNPHGLLRAGLFARVRLDAGTLAEALLVPDDAVVSDDDGFHVFVVEEGRARRRRVELGPRQGEGRILLAGLEGAVDLAVEGTGLLYEGAPVTRLD